MRNVRTMVQVKDLFALSFKLWSTGLRVRKGFSHVFIDLFYLNSDGHCFSHDIYSKYVFISSKRFLKLYILTCAH